MPRILVQRKYTLSPDAYNHLVALYKAEAKRPSYDNTYIAQWDGIAHSATLARPLEFSRYTLKPKSRTIPNMGVSKGLNTLITNLIEHSLQPHDWLDIRPSHIKQEHKFYPMTPPPALITSLKSAREYIQTMGTPTYRLPFYDVMLLPDERQRYEIQLLDITRDYLYAVAHHFHMKPYHRGGRNLRTAYVSVALEAIGIEYIAPPDIADADAPISSIDPGYSGY